LDRCTISLRLDRKMIKGRPVGSALDDNGRRVLEAKVALRQTELQECNNKILSQRMSASNAQQEQHTTLVGKTVSVAIKRHIDRKFEELKLELTRKSRRSKPGVTKQEERSPFIGHVVVFEGTRYVIDRAADVVDKVEPWRRCVEYILLKEESVKDRARPNHPYPYP
jgi:hypothetical protein